MLIDGFYDRETSAAHFKYTLYGPDGSILNSLKMLLEGTCSNPMIYQRNPVFMQDKYYYGYYAADLGPAALLDVASGDSIALEGELVPALMSHTHPNTSLRVVFTNWCYSTDENEWTVTDAEGRFIPSIELNYIK